ncbi:MAG: penicillin-binding transpeptidase domain-containing protein [Candidatus Promineifilaceae bacterium]
MNLHIRFHHFLLMCLLLLLSTCSGIPLIEDAYNPVTPTAKPSPTPQPTPTAVAEQAAGIGQAFYRLWQEGEYASMYTLLAERSRGLIPEETFIELYTDVMETARVVDLQYQPLGAFQNGASAEFAVRVTMETAVVGNVIREHTMPLVYENAKWRIVWDEALIMPDLVGGNYLQLEIQSPVRAELYDRNEVLLSSQTGGMVVGVIPEKLEDEDGYLWVMSQMLSRPIGDMKAAYAGSSPSRFMPLGVVNEETLQGNFNALEPYFNKGLQTQATTGRMYTEQGIAPHLIGYVNFIPQELEDYYWERGYRADERVGISGAEATAEEYLAGRRGGQLLLMSPSGERLDIVQEALAVAGRDVHTTFDSNFQLAVQKALAEAVLSHPNGHSGAIVVLDVNTGAIRAMASYPTYDPSAFSEIRPNARAEVTTLLQDSRNPLLNRATQSAYPPGSTFKLVTTAAALASNQFAADSYYGCNGVWQELGPDLIKYDWLRSGHGTLTLTQGLTRSCNPWMYHIGFVLDGVDPFILPNIAHSFGLGEATGLEGVPETAGSIPDPDWKFEKYGQGWSPGDSVNMAIGQGFVSSTPLQIARMTSAIANGGTVYKPLLIDKVEETSGAPELIVQPEVMSTIPLSAEQLLTIQESMNNVTSGYFGTAVDPMSGLVVTTAGKTGTAQTGGEETEPHSWFTGYTPYEEPEIAIAIIMENAGEGSAVAAPMFRRIVELYYGIEPIPFPWQ